MTFKQKIIGGFLLLGLIPVMVYAAVSTYMNYHAGLATAKDSMETLQTSLSDRVENYFMTVHAQARTMSTNASVHDALRDLR